MFVQLLKMEEYLPSFYELYIHQNKIYKDFLDISLIVFSHF